MQKLATTGQRGLSLVELLISIGIGLLITLVIAYLYTESRTTYRLNDNLARLQENGRIAMEFIGRDLRMAGYWGCAGRSIASPINTLNDANAYAYQFAVPITGHEAMPAGTWLPSLPSNLRSVQTATDVITIRTVFGKGITVLDHPGGNPPGSADLKISSDHNLKEGDIVLVSDCSNAAVFQITNINRAGGFSNLVHNTGIGTPGNATKALGKEYTGGTIQRIASFTYYIRLNVAGRPSLYRYAMGRSEELVENVENMQISYGVDEDNDGDVDTYKAANHVTDWQRVRAVDIRLLLVSPDDHVATQSQLYRYHDRDQDGVPEAEVSPDRRLRYVYSSIIGLRNRLP